MLARAARSTALESLSCFARHSAVEAGVRATEEQAKAVASQKRAEEALAKAEENYATVGSRLGVSETALRSIAMRLRRRWRELIRAELAELVDSRAALDEEMSALQAALMD